MSKKKVIPKITYEQYLRMASRLTHWRMFLVRPEHLKRNEEKFRRMKEEKIVYRIYKLTHPICGNVLSVQVKTTSRDSAYNIF